MSVDSAIVVLDVGKTNVKLLVLSRAGRILDERKLENRSLSGPPYAHLDTDRIWQWMMQTIAELTGDYAIDAIVPTTHGSSAALVDDKGLVLPVMDYEAQPPVDVAEAFDQVRPSFDETKTPDLPQSQVVAMQLFWQQREFEEQFSRARWVLMYPQYWAWRLSGIVASELTSVGCHTHLWDPQRGQFSRLVDAMKWRPLFPEIRPAYEPLGPVFPEITRRTGLPAQCVVYNGIHDANSNYGLYLRNCPRPFSLISAGTWVVVMSPRLPLTALNEDRDTVGLVDLTGSPLPTARYMGGREFELLTAGNHKQIEPSDEDVNAVIAARSFLLPSFVPGGPFTGRTGIEVGPRLDQPGQLTARATLYLALMTTVETTMLRTDGDLIIDGGFSNNRLYCRLVAALCRHDRIYINANSQGTALGAGMLAVWQDKTISWPPDLYPADPLEHPDLSDYASQWNDLIKSEPG